MKLSLPATLWTELTRDSSTRLTNRSANFTLRLAVYRNDKLFPVGRAGHDVITDVITVRVGQYNSVHVRNCTE